MKKRITPEQADIKFCLSDSNKLSVTIKTPMLTLRSVKADRDYQDYFNMFDDPQVMSKYAYGKRITDPSLKEIAPGFVDMQVRLNRLEGRWNSNNPFSAFSVFDQTTDEFLGFVSVGQSGGNADEAEIAYMFNKQSWGKGIGREAVSTVVNCFVPYVMMRGYKLNGCDLKNIMATARLDNMPSQKILFRVGCTTDPSTVHVKFGAERYIFNSWAKQVKNQYHHYYNQRDKQNSIFIPNQDDIDMAESAFGTASNTAKLWQAKLKRQVCANITKS